MKKIIIFSGLLILTLTSCTSHSHTDEEYEQLANELKLYKGDSSSYVVFDTKSLGSNQTFLGVQEIDERKKENPTTHALISLSQGVPIKISEAQNAITKYVSTIHFGLFGKGQSYKKLRSFYFPANIFADYLPSANLGNIAYFKLFLACDDPANYNLSLVVIPYDKYGKYITLAGNMVYNQIAACPAICPEDATIDNSDDYYSAKFDNFRADPKQDDGLYYPRSKGGVLIKVPKKP